MAQSPTTDINSNQTRSEKKSSVDIAEIVKRYVWEVFSGEKPLKYITLREKDVEYEIIWKDVRFIHGEPDYKKLKPNPQQPPKPTTLVLYSTTFDNNTKRPQKYSFKTEKSTTSTLQVEVEECVTIEQELSLSLKAPGDLMELGAGFKREKSITHTKSETDEETLTWGGDSEIEVAEHSSVTVSLEVEEKTDNRTYEILSHMYGPVSINILRKKDHKHVRTYGWMIEEIIDENATIKEKKTLKVDASRTAFPFKVVSYRTRGMATFKYGARQHISLAENKITLKASSEQTQQKQTPI